MDPAAIVGIVLAFGAVFGSMIMEGGSPAALFLPAPLLLVFVRPSVPVGPGVPLVEASPPLPAGSTQRPSTHRHCAPAPVRQSVSSRHSVKSTASEQAPIKKGLGVDVTPP